MTTCSLELAKELYELSGWDDTYRVNAVLDDPYLTNKTHAKGMEQDWVPAYDLGYLLRKLKSEGLPRFKIEYNNGDWLAYTTDKNTLAATPEDAAAQLCIQLFQEGILKK